MNIILEALKNSILITGLVIVMMLLIEYVNIRSHGESFKKLKKSESKLVLVMYSIGLIILYLSKYSKKGIRLFFNPSNFSVLLSAI